NRFRRQPGYGEWGFRRELLLRFSFELVERIGIVQIVDRLGVSLPVAGEGRIDQARNDCVDGDAVLAEFQGGRLHQADNAPFRGGISSTILRAVLSLRRGGNDDAAAAVLHQVRSYRADRVAGAGQIDIDLV